MVTGGCGGGRAGAGTGILIRHTEPGGSQTSPDETPGELSGSFIYLLFLQVCGAAWGTATPTPRTWKTSVLGRV